MASLFEGISIEQLVKRQGEVKIAKEALSREITVIAVDLSRVADSDQELENSIRTLQFEFESFEDTA